MSLCCANYHSGNPTSTSWLYPCPPGQILDVTKSGSFTVEQMLHTLSTEGGEGVIEAVMGRLGLLMDYKDGDGEDGTM